MLALSDVSLIDLRLGPPSDIWISAYMLLFWPLSGLWGHFPDSEGPIALMSDVI